MFSFAGDPTDLSGTFVFHKGDQWSTGVEWTLLE